jgi:Response regulator receiver domain
MDERRLTGRVLVVDDETPIRELVRQALEDEGCAVATAADGAALAHLRRARAAGEAPDVILLEWQPLLSSQRGTETEPPSGTPPGRADPEAGSRRARSRPSERPSVWQGGERAP